MMFRRLAIFIGNLYCYFCVFLKLNLAKHYLISSNFTNAQGGWAAEMKIYPNPTNSEVNIIWNTPILGQINIHDITGKIVMNKSIFQNQRQDKFDVQDLLPGIYLIRIPELNLTKKLMIK